MWVYWLFPAPMIGCTRPAKTFTAVIGSRGRNTQLYGRSRAWVVRAIFCQHDIIHCPHLLSPRWDGWNGRRNIGRRFRTGRTYELCTTASCPQCRRIKPTLEASRIPFRTMDVSEHADSTTRKIRSPRLQRTSRSWRRCGIQNDDFPPENFFQRNNCPLWQWQESEYAL